VGGDARVSLDAVAQAALADAESRAREIRDAAGERARRLLAAARAQADALLRERRASAERWVELEQRRRLARAHADAHALVLGAQRSVLLDAREAAHAAARALRDDTRYAQLIERLAVQARQRLAHAGTVEIRATPDGGLIARAGSLQIDHSLHILVERCLRDLAGEAQRLWR